MAVGVSEARIVASTATSAATAAMSTATAKALRHALATLVRQPYAARSCEHHRRLGKHSYSVATQQMGSNQSSTKRPILHKLELDAPVHPMRLRPR